MFPPDDNRPDHLLERVAQLHSALRDVDPRVLASRTGAVYDDEEGAFRLSAWADEVVIAFPSFEAVDATGRPANDFLQALLAYYFYTADGTPPAVRWIAFSELPDGTFYTDAFQRYTGRELVRRFGNDLDAFSRAAEQAGGRPIDLGDAAYAFQVLPRVALAAVAWRGDDEFTPSYRLLFDAAVSHYLTTDGCAVLGSVLTRRLLREADTS